MEIAGEALSQLARIDAALAARISDHRRVIAFRNILIHGYASVDDRLVWDVVDTKPPVLRREVDALLGEGLIPRRSPAITPGGGGPLPPRGGRHDGALSAEPEDGRGAGLRHTSVSS